MQLSDQITKILKKHWHIVFVAVAIIIITLNVLSFHFTAPYQSDGVELQNNLHYWLAGHHQIAYLGSDNFLLKLPYYLLVEHLGISPERTLFLTFLTFMCGAFFLFYWSGKKLNSIFGWFRDSSLAVAFLYLISIRAIYLPMMNANVRNIEVGLAFVLLVPLAVIWRRGIKHSYEWLTVGGLSLLMFSDPYFTFTLFLPLLLLLLIYLVFKKTKKQEGKNAFAFIIVASYMISRLLFIIAHHFGFNTQSPPIQLLHVTDLYSNIHGWLKSQLIINQADFRGSLSEHTIFPFTNFVLLVVLLLYSVLVIMRKGSKLLINDPWQLFMLAIAAITIAIYILQPPALIGQYRYLILSVFGLAIITAFLLRDLNSVLKPYIVSLIGLTVFYNVYATSIVVAAGNQHPNTTNYMVIDQIQKTGIAKGYTDYWSANINTYLSRYKTLFLQVYCNPQKQLQPMNWLVDSAEYHLPAIKSFYLYDRTGFYTNGCTIQKLNSQLGKPASIVHINQEYDLAIYNYDIFTKLTNSQ